HAFPAFWSRDSGLAAPLRVETAAEAARAHRLRAALGLEGGQLLAVPIPPEHEIPPERLAPAIAAALAEAEALGLTGKPVTPFLLSKVLEATQGASLEANIALVLNNARVAAQVARALAEG
ncbi:MAG: pseudouridine-5'-phosphate glycosidase, partial [Pseudomonadota bacterium]